MNDVLSMYRVIHAEHAALVAELAERERRRGDPRAGRSRPGSFPNVLRWLRVLGRPTARTASRLRETSATSVVQEALQG